MLFLQTVSGTKSKKISIVMQTVSGTNESENIYRLSLQCLILMGLKIYSFSRQCLMLMSLKISSVIQTVSDVNESENIQCYLDSVWYSCESGLALNLLVLWARIYCYPSWQPKHLVQQIEEDTIMFYRPFHQPQYWRYFLILYIAFICGC